MENRNSGLRNSNSNPCESFTQAVTFTKTPDTEFKMSLGEPLVNTLEPTSTRINVGLRPAEIPTPKSNFSEKALYKSAAFGKELKTVSIRWMVLSADMSTLYTGGSSCVIHVWNMLTLKKQNSLEGHTGSIQKFILTVDESSLISASSDKTVRIFDLETCSCKGVLVGHSATILDLVMSQNEETLYTSSADNSIKIWSLKFKKCLKTISGHRDFVWSLALANDGNFLISSSFDGSLRKWALDSFKYIEKSNEQSSGIFSMVLSQDEQILFTGHEDGSVRLWSTDSLAMLNVYRNSVTERIRRLILIEADKSLLSMSEQGRMILWETKTGFSKSLVISGVPIAPIFAFSRDCSKLVTVDQDSNLNIWKSFFKFGDVSATNQLELSRDLETLLKCDLNSSLTIKNIEYQEPLDGDEYVLTLGNLEGRISLKVELARRSALVDSCNWQSAKEMSIESFSELVNDSQKNIRVLTKSTNREITENFKYIQTKEINSQAHPRASFGISEGIKLLQQKSRRDEKLVNGSIHHDEDLEFKTQNLNTKRTVQTNWETDTCETQDFSMLKLKTELNDKVTYHEKLRHKKIREFDITRNHSMSFHKIVFQPANSSILASSDPNNKLDPNNEFDKQKLETFDTDSISCGNITGSCVIFDHGKIFRGHLFKGQKHGLSIEASINGFFLSHYSFGQKTDHLSLTIQSPATLDFFGRDLPTKSKAYLKKSHIIRHDWQRTLLISPLSFSLLFLPLDRQTSFGLFSGLIPLTAITNSKHNST